MASLQGHLLRLLDQHSWVGHARHWAARHANMAARDLLHLLLRATTAHRSQFRRQPRRFHSHTTCAVILQDGCDDYATGVLRECSASRAGKRITCLGQARPEPPAAAPPTPSRPGLPPRLCFEWRIDPSLVEGERALGDPLVSVSASVHSGVACGRTQCVKPARRRRFLARITCAAALHATPPHDFGSRNDLGVISAHRGEAT